MIKQDNIICLSIFEIFFRYQEVFFDLQKDRVTHEITVLFQRDPHDIHGCSA